jgi:hypothetical protein
MCVCACVCVCVQRVKRRTDGNGERREEAVGGEERDAAVSDAEVRGAAAAEAEMTARSFLVSHWQAMQCFSCGMR